MIALALRSVAVGIAIAAIIDPRITLTARGRSRVAVHVSDAGTIPAIARASAETLTRHLRADFDVVSGRDDEAAAAVFIGGRYPAAPPPGTQRVFTVTAAPSSTEPDVRVSAVRVPMEVPRRTLIHVEADVDAVNAVGVTSTLIVRVGQPGTEVGRATHAWTGGTERWRMAVDVTPLGLPPWRLRVDVSNLAGERATVDNGADALVAAAEPMRVFVYAPRPSWSGTFVRRALENDSRFEVGSRGYVSRGIQVTAGEAEPLQSIAFDRVRAIVVAGLDRLTAGDARALERFMREREGSVVLLPDSRRDVRTIAQWLAMPMVSEVLLEKAGKLLTEPPLPSLAVTEMLTLGSVPVQHVLARASGSNAPVIAVMPYGGGRLVVSGALDAWRYRADDHAAFDRFWQSVIAGLAMAAPPVVEVQVLPAVITPGEPAEVRVLVRRAALGVTRSDTLSLSATVNSIEPVRLWPEPAPDTFRGSFVAPRTAGVGRLEVAADGVGHAAGTASFVVADGARAALPAGVPLALLSSARGGIDVVPEQLSDLERRLRQEIASPPTRVNRHPMRSAWWLAPFVGCLGGECWIRRRRGLR